MKRLLIFLVITFIFSCQEKKTIPDNGQDLDDTYIQEIGKLVYPEKIDTRQKKVGSRSEKKDYIIDITNSDSLKENSKYLDRSSKNVAYLYKQHLLKNHRNPRNIIVNIYRKNGNNQSFEFEEKSLVKLETD